MNTFIESRAAPAGWTLLVGPHSLNTTLLNAIARLGEGGPLHILDGGNRFNAYGVARAARGCSEVLSRITVARAFTCYQVLSLLESTPSTHIPLVILDLLSTFYDESVRAEERKRLLRNCTRHLERLAGASAPLLISVHPPRLPSQAAVELLGLLQASAADTYFIQPEAQAPEPLSLF